MNLMKNYMVHFIIHNFYIKKTFPIVSDAIPLIRLDPTAKKTFMNPELAKIQREHNPRKMQPFLEGFHEEKFPIDAVTGENSLFHLQSLLRSNDRQENQFEGLSESSIQRMFPNTEWSWNKL